ncbi:hypothetical protein TIFTF001_017680 [Ficus carica]|uniref:Uncharacterized protein n=1 Tax=Ficus carica TaxID=3494 RepID=A0AA88A9N9_FICCA|nr:hypothetical protein TIFTF001_017680 [Ficus carica]
MLPQPLVHRDHRDSKLAPSGIRNDSPWTKARDGEIFNIRPRVTVNRV